MKAGKGFTLVELMVVVLIVGILAAVAIPMISGRIDAAKWTEGKTGAGTVAAALRTYCAENGSVGASPSVTDIGIRANELAGKYFDNSSYAISNASYNGSTGLVTYTITITPKSGVTLSPSSYTLDQTSTFTAQ